MRLRLFLVLLVAACGTEYASTPFPDAGGVDASAGPGDASTLDGATGPDALSITPPEDAPMDMSLDAGPPPPFADHLILRIETDSPGGLTAANVWRDLSRLGKTISLAGGTATVKNVGMNGASAMAFDANGTYFQVPDDPDLQFGATDDFFVVARATIDVPLEDAGGCSFHYLFSKFDPDGLTAAQLRVCPESTGLELTGALKISSAEATLNVPASDRTSFDVVSFGRTQSGKSIETYAAGMAATTALTQTFDVTAQGSNFIIGGGRETGTGALFGGYQGMVNRFYVYRGPPGTFAAGDFATIRAAVKNATPLP